MEDRKFREKKHDVATERKQEEQIQNEQNEKERKNVVLYALFCECYIHNL